MEAQRRGINGWLRTRVSSILEQCAPLDTGALATVYSLHWPHGAAEPPPADLGGLLRALLFLDICREMERRKQSEMARVGRSQMHLPLRQILDLSALRDLSQWIGSDDGEKWASEWAQNAIMSVIRLRDSLTAPANWNSVIT